MWKKKYLCGNTSDVCLVSCDFCEDEDEGKLRSQNHDRKSREGKSEGNRIFFLIFFGKYLKFNQPELFERTKQNKTKKKYKNFMSKTEWMNDWFHGWTNNPYILPRLACSLLNSTQLNSIEYVFKQLLHCWNDEVVEGVFMELE